MTRHPGTPDPPEREFCTFSIAARCARTRALGVAVATAVPAVGSNCSYIGRRTGAIATQAWVNPYLGIDGLETLRAGMPAAQALDSLLAGDPRRDIRQLGIVDAQGRSAAHTGVNCKPWCGHITGDGYAIQGNLLQGRRVLTTMQAAFEESAGIELAERLLRALEAGDTAGGDQRGRQSSAIKVVADEEYPLIDLRVDEHTAPVGELRRVFEVAKTQLQPFVATFPTRANPAGTEDPAVSALLALRPAARPGATSWASTPSASTSHPR
jgi:uncharacterized Ntn-hydrolase superfamily protein